MDENNNPTIKQNSFYEIGNDHLRWLGKGYELLRASEVLERAYLKAVQDTFVKPKGEIDNDFLVLPEIIFLKALALENYIKGLYLYQGNKLVTETNYIGYAGHQLEV